MKITARALSGRLIEAALARLLPRLVAVAAARAEQRRAATRPRRRRRRRP